MASKKYSEEQIKEYRARMDVIEKKIPQGFASLLLAKAPGTNINRINNFRYGKTTDFILLAALEEIIEEISKEETV